MSQFKTLNHLTITSQLTEPPFLIRQLTEAYAFQTNCINGGITDYTSKQKYFPVIPIKKIKKKCFPVMFRFEEKSGEQGYAVSKRSIYPESDWHKIIGKEHQ